MKMRATLIWEYEIPASDLQAIKDSEENGDPTDEFIEEAESEFYNNDPGEFLSQRLMKGCESIYAVDFSDHMEHVTRLKVEVVEHGSHSS